MTTETKTFALNVGDSVVVTAVGQAPELNLDGAAASPRQKLARAGALRRLRLLVMANGGSIQHLPIDGDMELILDNQKGQIGLVGRALMRAGVPWETVERVVAKTLQEPSGNGLCPEVASAVAHPFVDVVRESAKLPKKTSRVPRKK